MKKKFLVKIGAILSAALLLTPVISASAQGITGILQDRVEHTDLNFEDLECIEMQESDFDAIVAGLEELASDANNSDAVIDVITAMEDYACEMMGYYTIAHIYTTLEADNDFYDERLQRYDDMATSISDKIMINYQIVANSPCSDALKARIDDEDEWQDILDYEPMTDEQKELSSLETELSLKYDSLYIADYTYNINGTDYTMDELGEAYENGTINFNNYIAGINDIIQNRNQVLGELYLELVDVRTQIARSYGYDNYADYAYEKVYDRDYSPADLDNYREQVKEYMIPLEDELYDLLYSTYVTEYRELFNQEITDEECIQILGEYLPYISEDMMISYNYMVDHNMINIAPDDAKAPGGYTTSINMYNAPYMFNCADGDYSDMQTLIHEFGHYNQMYFGSEDFWYYGGNNLDLAEIHSQGLEVIFMEYSDDIYGEYGKIMDVYNAFNQVYASIEGCKEDAFQYAVYSNPDGLTIDKLNQLYYDVCVEYGDEEFYNTYYLGQYGLCDSNSIYEWIEVPHTFQSPMYYISYSVSISAVEELRDILLKDRDAGIELYLKLVDAGEENDFQETLENHGINNPLKNPRFDVYADNIRISLGLIDADSDSVVIDNDDDDIVDVDDDTVVDAGDDDVDVTDSDRTFEQRETQDVADSMMLVWILAAVGGALVIAMIVIIIALAKKPKEKSIAKDSKTGSNLNSNLGNNPNGFVNNMANMNQNPEVNNLPFNNQTPIINNPNMNINNGTADMQKYQPNSGTDTSNNN